MKWCAPTQVVFSLLTLAVTSTAIALSGPGAPSHLAYLVVGASAPSASQIAFAARPLWRDFPESFVFRSSDCGDSRQLFGVALGVFETLDRAKVALQEVRGRISSAYLRPCKIVAHSLLSLGFPAVDRTIADVPPDAVNWSESDRVSSAIALSDGRHIVVQRSFVLDADDPDEGRRVRVHLVNGDGGRHLLHEDCPMAKGFVTSRGFVAFECAGAEAGPQLLHDSVVFDVNGHQIAAISSCRAPRFEHEGTLACEEESVDSRGRLKLRRRTVRVGVGPKAAVSPAD